MGWLRRRRDRRLRWEIRERAVMQARRLFQDLEDNEALIARIQLDRHGGVIVPIRARGEEWRRARGELRRRVIRR